MGIRIVKVRPGDDVEVIRRLDRVIFKGSPKAVIDGPHWWVAYDGNKPVGFAGMQTLTKKRSSFYLCRNGVLKAYQGQGIGKALLKARMAYARRLAAGKPHVVETYVMNYNFRSANNLIKQGFKVCWPDDLYVGKKNVVYFNRVVAA